MNINIQFNPDGSAQCLWTDAISLHDLGRLQIRVPPTLNSTTPRSNLRARKLDGQEFYGALPEREKAISRVHAGDQAYRVGEAGVIGSVEDRTKVVRVPAICSQQGCTSTFRKNLTGPKSRAGHRDGLPRLPRQCDRNSARLPHKSS
jgi:hypothetical protein